MKLKICALLSAVLLCMPMTVAYAAYPDLPSTHYAYEKANTLNSLGILSLIVQDGAQFYPTQNITREEFFALIIRAVYGVNTTVAETPFVDFSSVKEQYAPYISVAYKNGILRGISTRNGLTCNPKEDIKREEVATIIARALSLTATKTHAYADSNEISDFAVSAINALYENGIMVGYPDDNTFKPKANLTRAEAVSLTYAIATSAGVNDKNYVSAYAGSGDFGNKDAKLLESTFGNPMGIAKDEDGNLYVIDTNNNQVRKISEGNVSAYAGSVDIRDEYGHALGLFRDGDSKNAFFNKPSFAAVNSDGKLLVADTNNNMIRLVDQSKTAVFAGAQGSGYTDGKGDAARFNQPNGIAIAKDGTIYVADSGNHCIRAIDKNGNVSIYAGKARTAGYANGSALTEALFNYPVGLAIGSDGALYVADTGNQRIRKITKSEVVTIAGGADYTLKGTDYYYGDFADGTGTNARFNFPMGIDFLDSENLIIADSKNNRIRQLNITTNQVTTLAGSGDLGVQNGKALTTGLQHPTDVVCVGNAIYFSDTLNNMIKKLTIIK